MAVEPKIVKGYVKTVNTIWLVCIALAVGFTGGVVFTSYRNSAKGPMVAQQQKQGNGAPSLSAEQQAALRSLLQRTKNNPKDVEAWNQVANLYFDSGQFELAISAYEQSLAIDDSKPDIWTDLGVMYRRAGDSKKAIASFDRAISINPRHPIALFNKGVVLMHDLQDPDGALATWETLINVDPQARTPSGQLVKDLVEELKKGSAS